MARLRQAPARTRDSAPHVLVPTDHGNLGHVIHVRQENADHADYDDEKEAEAQASRTQPRHRAAAYHLEYILS
jgi:hypothetical protein